MKYQIIDSKLVNNGGKSLIHITEVWLQEENRTVFVYTGESLSTIVTVDYLSSNLEIEDFDQVEIESLTYYEPVVHSDYFDLHRDCLYRYTEAVNSDLMRYTYVAFDWLPVDIQSQITKEQQQYVAESGSLYKTNGCRFEVPTEDVSELILFTGHQPKSLKETLSASLSRLKDKAMIDKEYMDTDDYGELMTTINYVEYWLSKQ